MSAAPLNIAIADDEPLARLRLQHLCEDLNDVCPNAVCAQYEHGSQLINALPSWRQGTAPDVLLLDINMPGLSGVEIAAYLKQHAPTVAVVFVTAEPEHALAAFEVSALDYVLKPVRVERLLKALQKIAGSNQVAMIEQTLLAVHDGERTLSLPLSQVLYFKSDSKTTQVRTVERSFTCTQSLTELESWLTAQAHGFVRVHRNALLRRSAAGALHAQPECEVEVLGVPERLQVSRRMLGGLR
jgi:two-component system, LytTR family, response regulator AlgR